MLHSFFCCFAKSLFDNELVFVDKLIGADLRNNSAWNQRYFVLNHTDGFTPEVIHYELTYVMNRIRLVKNNESTWNYLRGLLQHGTGKLDQYPDVSELEWFNAVWTSSHTAFLFISQKLFWLGVSLIHHQKMRQLSCHVNQFTRWRHIRQYNRLIISLR